MVLKNKYNDRGGMAWVYREMPSYLEYFVAASFYTRDCTGQNWGVPVLCAFLVLFLFRVLKFHAAAIIIFFYAEDKSYEVEAPYHADLVTQWAPRKKNSQWRLE